MIYILNNIIQFDSSSGEVLRLSSNVEIAKLTPILNYILILLIKNNHVITSRTELIEEISNAYNINVSINTINQYLSMLRKLLQQQLNIDNAILNISKKGIILSSEIIIKIDEKTEVIEDKIQNTQQKINKNSELMLSFAKDYNNKKISIFTSNKKIMKTSLMAIVILFFFVSVYLFYFLTKSNFLYKPISYYKIIEVDGCPVYSFQKGALEVVNDIMKDHIKKFELKCENNDTFFYYSNASSSGKNKQSLLAKCEKNKTCITTRINWYGEYEK